MPLTRRTLVLGLPLFIAACGGRRPDLSPAPVDAIPLHPGETPELRALIRKWAAIHEIPESLLHRQIQRESGYNPAARNGPYWGLMQIHPRTAKGMGYDGAPEGLLDPDTNLHYAGKYLRGAYIVAEGDEDAAMKWYARGYYYEAKRKGLLEETGLKT